MENIIAHLDAIGAEVTIIRIDYSSDLPWRTSIRKSNDSIKLEVYIDSHSFQDSLTRAYNKFIQSANAGIDFAGVLEAPKSVTSDEEIPF